MVRATCLVSGSHPRTRAGTLVDGARIVGRVLQLALIRALVGLGPSASPASLAAVLVLDPMSIVLHRIRRPSIRSTSV